MKSLGTRTINHSLLLAILILLSLYVDYVAGECPSNLSVTVTPLCRSVPRGTVVNFECKVSNYDPGLCRGTFLWNAEPLVQSERTKVLSITANVTLERINCSFTVGSKDTKKSENASLQVLPAEPPITPNPKIEVNKNTSLISLSWSPQYTSIWPDQTSDSDITIDYYMIFIKRKDYGKITYTEPIIHNSELDVCDNTITPIESVNNISIGSPWQMCTELNITIWAYDRNNIRLPNKLNILDHYKMNPDESDVAFDDYFAALTSVMYCKNESKTSIRVYFELPQICSFEELNYTIIIKKNDGSNIKQLNYTHAGSECSTISLDITYVLDKDEEYLVMLIVQLPNTDTSTESPWHEFCTYCDYERCGAVSLTYSFLIILTLSFLMIICVV